MRRYSILFLAVMLLGASVLPVFAAAATPPPTSFQIQNPLGSSTLQDIIKQVTDAIRNLAIIVGAVMILWAGFNYLTAAGNPAKVQKANKVLMYTAIGLAIVFIGGGFVDLIRSILGAQ